MKIGPHDPWVPFSTHGSKIGFEQFALNAWNFEGRFAGVPGSGIIFVIGSDSTAGATSATDLEVYAFDSNVGGQLVALTADVTDGTANAINHLTPSLDASYLAGQRTKTAADGGETRSLVNNRNDLFVVTNVHDALAGATPITFILSSQMSHGASAAFVGEGTAAGPQALVYSSAAGGTSNSTWDDRTLKIGFLAPGAVPEVLDTVKSHYVVLAGTRKLDDNPATED